MLRFGAGNLPEVPSSVQTLSIVYALLSLLSLVATVGAACCTSRLVVGVCVPGSFGMLIRNSSRFGPYPGRSRSCSLGPADPLRSQHTLDCHLSTRTKTRVYTRAAADRLARTRCKCRSCLFSLETSTLTVLSRAGPHFRPVLGFTLSPRRESKPATPRLAGELVRGPLLEERRSPNEIDQKPTLQRGR